MRVPFVVRACFLVLAAGCAPDEAPAIRHVVWISLDTTRADHLSCYGGEKVRTPAIDELARNGVRFADVTTPAPTTLAAHTSMMTGTYPHTHGVVRNGFVVDDANLMLAEVLRDAGFHTAGFLGSFALERRFAFHQGFAHFDEEFSHLVDLDRDQNQRPANEVTDAVLGHVDEVRGERLFLFAHYFDPHHPYQPPGTQSRPGEVHEAVAAHQMRTIGAAPGLAGLINGGMPKPLVEGYEPLPSGLDRSLAQRYGGEVAFVDQEIARLLAGLDERGVLDDALVIVTGDHGETFWEHADTWNHGLWVYQTTVAVPLIMSFPDGRAAGRVVETPVSTIDLFPSVCELLELEVPERVEGASLVPALQGPGPFERAPVFSQATQPGRRFEPKGKWGNLAKPRCVRDGRFKYVQVPYLGIEQLFDLDADPGETRNLLLETERTAEIRAVHGRLGAALADWVRETPALPSRFNAAQIEETRRRLMQLGYGGDAGSDSNEER